MDGSYALVRRRTPQPPRPPPRPPSRGIRIRVKKRVVRCFSRVTGRVYRAMGRWFGGLRRGFLRVGPDSGLGYVRVGEGEDRVTRTPKGHLVVYVRPTEEGGTAAARRVVVPVIYVNHPLFKRLLEEAEEKYGFDHPGGITIPCPVSEFEALKTKIARGRARNGPALPLLGFT
ncbi:hypothetical protein BVRB_1g018730 [Beta vulgaris subsp. vulgaris]|nr:hypothetical protein BVRB_1g018730 [Beta vulgaris subsp. vulgaris]